MLIPIRTDREVRSKPYVTYALIAACVLVFVGTRQAYVDAKVYQHNLYEGDRGRQLRLECLFQANEETPAPENMTPQEEIARANAVEILSNELFAAEATRLTIKQHPVYGLLLHKKNTKLYQFVTSLFMHADWMHLAGNMIFLLAFGRNLEDRLGRFGFLFFYLAVGVFAGLGHWVTSDASALGASGAISGVTGAFLALFPRTRITFLFFFFIIGVFEVPAMVVILAYFGLDLLSLAAGGEGVAYTAHIAGTFGGFMVGMGLLATRLSPRESCDLLSLFEQKRRRDQFRRLTQQGYQPWEGKGLGGKGEAEPMTAEETALFEKRQAILRAANAHDFDLAATLYRALLETNPEQALGPKTQFDVTNQLYAKGHHAEAAQGYELLLKAYPRHENKGQAQLMLGKLYAQALNRPEDAKPLLKQAADRLDGPEHKHAIALLESL